MTALRLARGVTGRNLIVKFSGCYHGHSDGLLAAAGSGVATAGMPGSAGVTEAAASETIVVDYNDRAALEAVFAAHGERIAAVITEAVPCNMGVVEPAEGFNAFLREITRRHGALLIWDEVLTGFRATATGGWGLSGQPEGWTPDIWCFGKVIAAACPRPPWAAPPRSWTTWPRSAPCTRPAPSPGIRWPWPPATPRSPAPTRPSTRP